MPWFFEHEGAMLRLVAGLRPDLVPPVLAFRPWLTLLGHVDGADQWGAAPEIAMSMVAAIVDLQQAVTVDQLRATRLPDWRSSALIASAHDLCSRKDVRATLVTEAVADLDRLVDKLPHRFATLDKCGIEPTIMHPTSIQATGAAHRDTWCSGLGRQRHRPSAAFLERMPEGSVSSVQDRWLSLLTGQARRANDLIAPIAALRQALIYRSFLDQIEPAERRYHATDLPLWLGEAITSSGHG